MNEIKSKIKGLFVIASVFGTALALSACGATEAVDDRDSLCEGDPGCVCFPDEGGDDGMGVDCFRDDASGLDFTRDGRPCTCFETDPNPEPMPNPDPNPELESPGPPLRFVMLQDETDNPSGDLPGPDIDAVSVIKAGSQEEVFADRIGAGTEVDCTGNLACDPSEALGPPDAFDPDSDGCELNSDSFIALNGGRLIVSFGDLTLENGDVIVVHEARSSDEVCAQFSTGRYSVMLSDGDDLDGVELVALGEIGSELGGTSIEVSGLP